MEKEELGANDRNKKSGESKVSFKHGLAHIWVIRNRPYVSLPDLCLK